MSYFNCKQGGRCEDCNGYIGPLDSYACLCRCHDTKPEPDRALVGDTGQGVERG